MGKRFFFELKSLPDFSLTRYQAINLSDLGSVVKNNNVFLRQLHSLGLVLNMSFHLYYSFIPHLPHGERIKVVLMCQEESEKETVSNHSGNQKFPPDFRGLCDYTLIKWE